MILIYKWDILGKFHSSSNTYYQTLPSKHGCALQTVGLACDIHAVNAHFAYIMNHARKKSLQKETFILSNSLKKIAVTNMQIKMQQMQKSA